MPSQIVAILSGGFTAIGTMTTAYFGIKSISNATSNIAELHSRQQVQRGTGSTQP